MTDLVIRVRADGTAEVARGMRNVDQAVTGMGGKAGAASQQMGKLGTTAGTARQGLAGLHATTGTAASGLLAMTLRTTGLVAGLAGVGLGIRGAVSSFVDYDSTMRRVGAISGATEAQMMSMRDMAQELGATTKFSAGEAAQGFQFLATAGLDAEQSLSALPGVLQLAAAGALDLGTAADISTNILSGYGFEIAELSRVNDVLAKAFTSSNTNLQQLGTAFATAGPVAAAAGQEFEVTAAVLGLMANAGFAGERSGTALRGALARLLAPTAEVTDTLARLGVEVTDSSGAMRSLDAIMIELGGSGMTAADAIKIFGQEAGPAMLAAIGQGEGAIVSMVEKMRDAEGTAATVAGALEGSLGGAMTQLRSAAEGLGIALVDLVQGALRRAIEGISAFVGAVTSGLRAITPAWTEVFGRITQQTATVMTGLVTMTGNAIAGMTGEFDVIEPSWLAVVATIPRALEATVQTAVLLAVRMTLQIGNAMQELAPRSAQVWNSIQAYTLTVMASIEEAVINAYRAILGAIGGLVADAGVELQGLARTTSTVSETMARGIEDAAIAMQRLGRDMQTTGEHSSSLRARIGDLDAENAALDQSMRGVNQTYRTQIDTIDEMIAEYWAEVEAIQRAVDGRDEVVEAITREGEVREQIEQQMDTAIEQLEQSTEGSKAAAGAAGELTEAVETIGPAAQSAGQAQVQAAEESERAWKQLGDSIQSNLSSAFENLLKGTGNVFETIKNWFIKLLADLAAAALARPIMIAVGMSGAGTALAAGGAAGGGGGFFGGGAGLGGTLYSSALLGLGGGLAGIAPTFASGLLATGGMIGQSGLIGGSLAALGNAGSLAMTGNLMAAAGAALPVLLPIAAAVIAFGGLLKSTPPRAFIQGEINSGEIIQQVEKKGGEAAGIIQLFDDIRSASGDYLDSIGGALGGTNDIIDLHIRPDRLRFNFVLDGDWANRMEIDVDPEDEAGIADAIGKTVLAAVANADLSGAAEPLAAYFESLTLDAIAALPQGAAEEILQAFSNIGEAAERAADQLPFLGDAIRELAAQGETGAQDLARFTVAAIAIGDALSTDPMEAYEDAIKDVGKSAYESARQQASGLQDLIREYDGSVAGTEALAQATLSYKQAAVQAAAEIAAAQDQIAASVKSSTERILLDTMTAAERQEYYMTQASNALDELSRATDPQQVAALFAEFERYTMESWNALSDEQKQLLRDNYIQSLEEGAGVANRQLEEAAQTLQAEFEATSNAVTLGMLRAFEAAGLVVEGSADQFAQTILWAGAALRDAAGWVADRIANASVGSGDKAPFSGPTTTATFAEGGLHSGGWRMVGERGPELEFTGPSRIFSNSDSRGLLGGAFDELRAEIRGLRQQVADYGRRRMETEQERASRERRMYDRARLG